MFTTKSICTTGGVEFHAVNTQTRLVVLGRVLMGTTSLWQYILGSSAARCVNKFECTSKFLSLSLSFPCYLQIPKLWSTFLLSLNQKISFGRDVLMMQTAARVQNQHGGQANCCLCC